MNRGTPMSNSEARKKAGEKAARNDLAATIVHRLTCTRCRQGWFCGGLGDEDYEAVGLITDLLDQIGGPQ